MSVPLAGSLNGADAAAGSPPGCYGKLPARADFIARRLPRTTVEPWDRWLQACLAYSQHVLGPAWQDHYLTAPPWRLVLPAGACGPAALIGVLVPSVDAVGRCFPLLIVQMQATAADPVDLAISGHAWFEAAEALALHALDDRFDLAALDLALPPVATFPATAPPRRNADPSIGYWTQPESPAARSLILGQAMPFGGHPALWWTGGGAAFRPALVATAGLIAPPGFAALLDGDAARHGWAKWSADAPGGEAPAGEADPAWDRDG